MLATCLADVNPLHCSANIWQGVQATNLIMCFIAEETNVPLVSTSARESEY
jgi:hypothetical protein